METSGIYAEKELDIAGKAMIENTFIILDRVGKRMEQMLWQQGIQTWTEFLNAELIKGISRGRKAYYDRKLVEAQKALYSLDSAYYMDKLPLREMWRLYEFFEDEAVYLDIETAGVDEQDMVTVIGVYDGTSTKTMIHRLNLDARLLKEELTHYRLLVTFNGSSFDVPRLNRYFPGVVPKIPHMDLRTACQLAGHTGGLKRIERKFGIRRSMIIENMYGGDALRLWKMYRATGDEHYLELLVEYNDEDIVNLKTIAGKVVRELRTEIENKHFRGGKA
jgi:uncharacterized protein YprB with RNaseH-like and TPR domain